MAIGKFHKRKGIKQSHFAWPQIQPNVLLDVSDIHTVGGNAVLQRGRIGFCGKWVEYGWETSGLGWRWGWGWGGVG